MSGRSLRTQLVAAVVLVTLAALLVAGVAARTSGRLGVDAYFDSYTLDADLDRIEEHRVRTGSWAGVGPLLREIGSPFDERLVLTTLDLAVLADSDPDQPLPALEQLTGDVEFVIDGEVTVLFTLARTISPAQEAALSALDRALLVAGLGAVLTAAVGALAVSRRLVRPLAALHDGVVAVARGDLDVRVPVDGPAEVAVVAGAVNDLATELSRSLAAETSMIADVAHDLRSPVANLRAYVEAMQDGVADPSGADLDVVHGEAARLARMIDDLAELSLASAGQLQLHPTPTDLRALVRDAIGALTTRATAADVTLTGPGTHDDGPPLVLDVDADRLRRALGNLLDNALRHAPAGSTVTVLVDRAGPVAVVTVLDEGPGIPAGQLEAVFQRLHRVDPARTPGAGGAGLGLATARSLVELHGGTLTARNRDVRGAAFTLTLPVG